MAITNWYVDEGASGANDGTSPTDAWESLETAIEYNSFTVANVNMIWIRRTTSHTMVSDIAATDDGGDDTPILFIGWPRAAIPNTTITQADFTNGSNIIDNVITSGDSPDRSKHVGRFITAPDGEQYLITAVLFEASTDNTPSFTIGSKLTNSTQTKYGKVWAWADPVLQYVRHPSTAWVDDDALTDADAGSGDINGSETAIGFLIDRDYAGSTVTGTNGKFQIEADEDYSNRPTWAAADGDSDNLALIDGNSADYVVSIQSDYYYGFRNLEFLNGADISYGSLQVSSSIQFYLQGCLFSVTIGINEYIIYTAGTSIIMNRCILQGSGSSGDTIQIGMYVTDVSLSMTNCAIFGCGDRGFYSYHAMLYLENVNLGIEMDNGDDEIYSAGLCKVFGRDVKLGGTNGYVIFASTAIAKEAIVSIENYQKILGDHKSWYCGGEYSTTTLTGATTPNKKLSDVALKITPKFLSREFLVDEAVPRIPLGEINADAGSQTFSFWIHNLTGVTLNDITATDDLYLQAEYVKSYDDNTEYTMDVATSTLIDIIDQAGNPATWVSLGVTCNPAVESKVRLWLCTRKYEVDSIFLDPQVVIT